jgi:O-acetyl-ADP-ribose deacetylase (regulator of RNase III)
LVIDEFHQVVNMTAKELESWLDSDLAIASMSAGVIGLPDNTVQEIGSKQGSLLKLTVNWRLCC